MPEDSTLEVFLSAVDVSQRLGKVSSAFPRNIWDLMDLVEGAMGSISPTGKYRIHAHPRIYGAQHIIGTVEAFDTEAHIYYDLNQNTCWRRFVVTKELCHLLFAPHGAKHLAATPEQIEQLIVKLLSGLEDVNLADDHIYGTEKSTILMAIEILLPFSERQQIEGKLAAVSEELLPAAKLEVAKYYRLPQQMLSLYLSPAYARWMELAKSIVPAAA